MENANRRSCERRAVAPAADLQVYVLNLPEPARVDIIDVSERGFAIRFVGGQKSRIHIPRYVAGYIVSGSQRRAYLWGLTRWSECRARDGRISYCVGVECRKGGGGEWVGLFR